MINAFRHAPLLSPHQAFFMNTLKLLRPGGVSVHTTELMLSHLDEVTSGHTSLWRYKDLKEVHKNASRLGFEVFPIDVHVGENQVGGGGRSILIMHNVISWGRTNPN